MAPGSGSTFNRERHVHHTVFSHILLRESNSTAKKKGQQQPDRNDLSLIYDLACNGVARKRAKFIGRLLYGLNPKLGDQMNIFSAENRLTPVNQ